MRIHVNNFYSIIAVSVSAEISPGRHIFGDNMVLQSGIHMPIWSSAYRGEQVVVKFADQEK